MCRFVIAVLLLLISVTSSAGAQAPSRLPAIAILDPLEPGQAAWLTSFKQGLAELGWVEGRTVTFEMRYAENRVERMATLARQAVTRKPDVIFTHGPMLMIRAVVEATGSIPIVVGASADLVDAGFAKSLARPGRNVTGMSLLYRELEQKRLETLKNALSKIRRVGVLVNPGASSRYPEDLRDSARPLDILLHFERVSTAEDIPRALTALKNNGADALLVQDGPLMARSVKNVAASALTQRLPSISQVPQFAESGGLLQYGADLLEMFRESARHVDQILRGARPGDIPIEQPAKFALIVNLRTAKALGVALPRSLLQRADQVIE
jgi:putative ABC transport system substrate-binding protein